MTDPAEATPAEQTPGEPPATGHPRIDAALAEAAASGHPDALARALDVLQSVLDTDPDDPDPLHHP